MNREWVSMKDYLKKRNKGMDAGVIPGRIFVGKTKNSVMIGPRVNAGFDEESFFRRIRSTCIYNTGIYRAVSAKTAEKILREHLDVYAECETEGMTVLEILNNGDRVIHRIPLLPGRKGKCV